MAGLFIGPLVHIVEFLIFIVLQGNRGSLANGLILFPIFIMGFASVLVGPLLGLGIVYLMRLFATKWGC